MVVLCVGTIEQSPGTLGNVVVKFRVFLIINLNLIKFTSGFITYNKYFIDEVIISCKYCPKVSVGRHFDQSIK